MNIYVLGFLFTLTILFVIDKSEDNLGNALKMLALALIFPITLGIIVGMVLKDKE